MKYSILLLFILLSLNIFSQTDQEVVKKIYSQSLTNGKSYDWLNHLSNQIGSRLSGSLGAEKAVAYTKEELDASLHYQVKSFASIYLENKDGKFIVHKLPNLAQISSINQILVDDYDKDGNLDALIAGNLFVSEVETPRNDAGYGLLLKGDGKGNFKSVPVTKSGFFVPGDVKDMATIKVGNKSYIIAAKNNDYLQFIEYKKS